MVDALLRQVGKALVSEKEIRKGIHINSGKYLFTALVKVWENNLVA